MSEVRDRAHQVSPDYREARGAMMSKALDSWRDAMMWGLISDEVRDEVKQEAANRFLRLDGSLRSEIMHHLEPDGRSPGYYESATEEAFRTEIFRALGKMPEAE